MMSTAFPDHQIGEFRESEDPVHLGLCSRSRREAGPKQWPSLKFFVGGAPIEHIQHIAGDMAKFGDYYWSKCWIYSIQLQCAFISGLLRKLSVSVVKINCLSSFPCPLKAVDVMYQATPHKEVTRYKVRQTFQ